MKGLVRFIIVLFFFTGMISCKPDKPAINIDFIVQTYSPVNVNKTNTVHTYVHYMPWFETRQSSANGQWGIHWTMNTKNPDIVDENGKREIASHFYPLIGPYASGDPNLIEYHLLLIKYAGIDGVLIDWYGSTDFNDYGQNRKNCEILIDLLSKTGLKFAVVYEDRIIKAACAIDPSFDRISGAQNDMLYLEQNYFNNSSYITVEGKPLLLVFGPEEFHTPAEWEEIFSVLSGETCFVVLNGKSAETIPFSSGEYIWVDNTLLNTKYAKKDQYKIFIGGAYPGFDDYYKEGGWGDGFDWQIDYNDGLTLKDNLDKAKVAGVDYLQLITWNDFGEGTMIEPTIEFNFRMLEIVQDFTEVVYTKNDLEEILNLYNLRKKLQDKPRDQKVLNQVFYYLVSLQTMKAYQLIDSLMINM
jgi:hypothetical protein